MKRLTIDELNRINAINGTLTDRYEYFKALAEILNARYTRVRWNKNFVEAIKCDDTTILDIDCKTVKGKMMIKTIRIEDHNKTEEHTIGQYEYWELKKGNLVKILDI